MNPERDIDYLIRNAPMRVVTDACLSSVRGGEFPAIVPTFKITPTILEITHHHMILDGADSEPFARLQSGKPIFAMALSRELFDSHLAADAHREFLYHDHAPIPGASILRAYRVPINPIIVCGGFAVLIMENMPRNDFGNDQWIPREFGTASYDYATCEDVLLYHSKIAAFGRVLRTRRSITMTPGPPFA